MVFSDLYHRSPTKRFHLRIVAPLRFPVRILSFYFCRTNANLVCEKIKRKNLSLSPCFRFNLVCRLIFGAFVRSVVCLQYGCRLRTIQRNSLL